MADNHCWQEDKSLQECVSHMYHSGLGSDVTFRVGLPDTHTVMISAHRFILISRSPVFEALFCGDWADNKEDTLNIEDIEPAIFRDFMRFLYTEDVEITEANALNLLCAAQKYIVPALENMCSEFLKTVIKIDNACTMLTQAVHLQNTALEKVSLEYIQRNTVNIFSSRDFHNLSQDALCLLLEMDELETKEEIDVIQACVIWANVQLRKQGLDPDTAKARDVLGEALYLIRFPATSLTDFTKELHSSTILTDTEKLAIYHYVITKEEACGGLVTGFRVDPRTSNGLYTLNRFETHATGCFCMKITHFVCFSVDKPISLVGATFYGTTSGQHICCVKVDLYNSEHNDGSTNECLLSLHQCGGGVVEDKWVQCSGEETPIPAIFDKPIELAAGKFYDMGVTLECGETFYGKGGKRVVTQAGCKFTFIRSARNPRIPNERHGQVPGFLFRKM